MLVCHSFKDTGRRHETHGLETALALARVSSFSYASFLSPYSHKVMQKGPGDTCMLSGLCYKREILSLGSLNLS